MPLSLANSTLMKHCFQASPTMAAEVRQGPHFSMYLPMPEQCKHSAGAPMLDEDISPDVLSGIQPVLPVDRSSSLPQPLHGPWPDPLPHLQLLSPSPHLTGRWLRQALPPSVFSAPACFTSDSALVSEATRVL